MQCQIEFEEEEDGRRMADIPALPGVMEYGSTMTEVKPKVEAMALRVIADRMKRDPSTMTHVGFAVA